MGRRNDRLDGTRLEGGGKIADIALGIRAVYAHKGREACAHGLLGRAELPLVEYRQRRRLAYLLFDACDLGRVSGSGETLEKPDLDGRPGALARCRLRGLGSWRLAHRAGRKKRRHKGGWHFAV